MIIDGFQKLTLLDFPEVISCIVFTSKCNFKCPFCHNSSLVMSKSKIGLISEEEIFKYLKKRKGIIDGVVISGGEPLIQKGIKEFILKIKNMDYKVKLDTNGSNPYLLKELTDEKLVDYVAMDIKNTFDKYNQTCGQKKVNIRNIKQSINILKQSEIDYEFRTTIVKEFHTINDIKEIFSYIGNSKYYLQNFIDSGNVIEKGLHGFTKEELTIINNKLNKKFNNFKIREL